MNSLKENLLKIYYHLDNPSVFITYEIEQRFFVSFMEGGNSGGEIILEINEDYFEKLNSEVILLNEVINKFENDKTYILKIFNKFLLEEEPFTLYQFDFRYFYTLGNDCLNCEEVAHEISKINFEKLYNKETKPSEI